MKIYGDAVNVDKTASLCDMQNACYLFFKSTHGRREEFIVHRGCLIVRCTADVCGKAVRMTAVHMYLPKGSGEDSPRPTLFCVSAGANLRSIAGAKRYIDRLLEHGEYEYGWEDKIAVS